jgi:hypothetical protein
MIDTPADVVLLTLVALGRLRVVSRLLLLLWSLTLSTVVKLAGRILSIFLGTPIGIMPRLTTPKAHITSICNRVIASHRHPSRSILTILGEIGTWCKLTNPLRLLLLTLLVGMLVLVLPVIDSLSSCAERCALRVVEARTCIVVGLRR